MFLIVVFFADSLIYNTQKENFDKKASTIFKAFKADDQAVIEDYLRQGFIIENMNIEVKDEGENQVDSQQENSDFQVEAPTDVEMKINSQVLRDKEKNFFFEETLKKDGKNQQVYISYPVVLAKPEILSLMWNVSPYFFLISLSVSSIIAIGYARYFSNKIKQMNHIVHKMAMEDHPEVIDYIDGDELQELKNNIHVMYCKLRKTMRALQEEVLLVKSLEDSRRLFMSGIVHELKTPIMNMILPLKEYYLEEDDGKKDFLKKQLDYLNGMSKLVSELLELSRIEETLSDEKVVIEPVLQDVITVYAEMLNDKKQTVELSVNKTSYMTISMKKLQKLFSNLLGNAIKYSPENSKIKIIVTEEYFKIENPILNSKLGLSIDELQKPFVSTDDQAEYPSHGLGLYLIQSMLQFYNYHYTCFVEEGIFIYQIYLE